MRKGKKAVCFFVFYIIWTFDVFIDLDFHRRAGETVDTTYYSLLNQMKLEM